MCKFVSLACISTMDSGPFVINFGGRPCCSLPKSVVLGAIHKPTSLRGSLLVPWQTHYWIHLDEPSQPRLKTTYSNEPPLLHTGWRGKKSQSHSQNRSSLFNNCNSLALIHTFCQIHIHQSGSTQWSPAPAGASSRYSHQLHLSPRPTFVLPSRKAASQLNTR